jgi:hypothetical protein
VTLPKKRFVASGGCYALCVAAAFFANTLQTKCGIRRSRICTGTFADQFLGMAAHAKKTFVWLWMAALLSATVGVSVQQVYCYCVGKTTVSLFDADDACRAHATPSADCCAKPILPKKSCCEKPADAPTGCTKKTTQVFQLKAEFEVGHFEFKKIETPQAWAFLNVFRAFVSPTFGLQKVEYQYFDRPPPALLSGRMICVRHGIFRC